MAAILSNGFNYFTALFMPIKLFTNAETTDYYVDGGVLCNYPLHAYDGKWETRGNLVKTP